MQVSCLYTFCKSYTCVRFPITYLTTIATARYRLRFGVIGLAGDHGHYFVDDELPARTLYY